MQREKKTHNKSFQWGSNIRPRPSSFEIGQFEAFVILYMWGLKQKCVQQVKFG